MTVTENGRKVTLTEGYDYRVLYENNIESGNNGKVIVRGNGTYKGELTAGFVIQPKQMKKLKVVTGSVSSAAASDLSQLPLHIYDGSKRLESGRDYTLSGYNTTSVSVTGKGNYTGSITAKFTSYNVSADKIINPDNIKLSTASVTYTGRAVKPEPAVAVNGLTFTRNKDYKVQYQNNVNAGTAYVIITGKGAYRGKAVKPFEIAPIKSALNINPVAAKTYNGRLQKPVVTVKDGNRKLKKNKDYSVTYENNLHAGKATIIITGKGNYEGIVAKTEFMINPQKISKASVKGTRSSLLLTYSRHKLRQGTDYETPSYDESSLKKNKIKVTITGKGDFTGSVTKTIKVQ